MLNIVLFGPPGAGKGTQAENVIKHYNLVHLSTGDMLRAEQAAGTELGKEVKAIMAAGNLVSDEIVIRIISSQIDSNPDAKGFIFDGFPRTVPQAEALDQLLDEKNTPIKCCVMMDVPDVELVARLLDRAKKLGREDDTEEVIQNRIMNYNKKTLPVAGYYQKQDKLHSVNGVGGIEDISGRISVVLDQFVTTTV